MAKWSACQPTVHKIVGSIPASSLFLFFDTMTMNFFRTENFNLQRILILTCTSQLVAYGFLSHGDRLPHMLHSGNSSEMEMILRDVVTSSGFKSRRFGLQLLLTASDEITGNWTVSSYKGLDDENTPGIFTVSHQPNQPSQVTVNNSLSSLVTRFSPSIFDVNLYDLFLIFSSRKCSPLPVWTKVLVASCSGDLFPTSLTWETSPTRRRCSRTQFKTYRQWRSNLTERYYLLSLSWTLTHILLNRSLYLSEPREMGSSPSITTPHGK